MKQSGKSNATLPSVNDEMSARTLGLMAADEKSAGTDGGLTGRLEFEMLIANLSARFVNLPPDQIDSEIKNAERGMCEVLDIDLAALWQPREVVPDVFVLTHLYSKQGGLEPLEQMLDDHFPWFKQQALLGRTVIISSLEELPAGTTRDRESARLFGIKSNLTLPLSVGGGPVFGILGLSTLREHRKWPDELVKRLQLVAQVFANALARKRADQERQQMEAATQGTAEGD